MNTFLGKTVIASQPGANLIEFRFSNGNYFYLSPAEAHAMGQWLITVQVPENKERGKETKLDEFGTAPTGHYVKVYGKGKR